MGFSRQEDWSGLPFPSLGDLPDLGIKPSLLHLWHWQVDFVFFFFFFLTTSTIWEAPVEEDKLGHGK